MVKIFGSGDDKVIIRNSSYEVNEIGCCCSNVRIWFTDGTVILMGYFGFGVWRVNFEKRGTADMQLDSGTFSIDAEIKAHEVIDR